jgi:hypothetical protein
MSKLNGDVVMSSPSKKANLKVETSELSMEELGNVTAGSLPVSAQSAPTNDRVMKTKHDTVKNSISNVR